MGFAEAFQDELLKLADRVAKQQATAPKESKRMLPDEIPGITKRPSMDVKVQMIRRMHMREPHQRARAMFKGKGPKSSPRWEGYQSYKANKPYWRKVLRRRIDSSAARGSSAVDRIRAKEQMDRSMFGVKSGYGKGLINKLEEKTGLK